MVIDSADVTLAKRLLDYAKQRGFVFQRAAPGEDAPLVGNRVSGNWVDLIHIEGFSRDCFAWRKQVSSLIVPGNSLVERRVDGSVFEVLNEVLTWEPGPEPTG
ncbi:MAG: hypothetical protein ACRDSH_11070 [Pseudonocardiaceae bacterium]